MASLFTHAFVGTALGQAGISDWRKDWRFWCLVIVCSILPDIDSIGFLMGVPYGNLWGHRGMTHSLVFSAVLALCLSAYFSKVFRRPLVLAALLFVVTASHGVLDAMTNGGLGVAFFSPFNQQRFFFSWRPIRVSPIGLTRFFTNRGLRIMRAKFYGCGAQHWVLLLPSKLANYGGVIWKQSKKPNQSTQSLL